MKVVNIFPRSIEERSPSRSNKDLVPIYAWQGLLSHLLLGLIF
jgi:hypothetical protein